MHERSAAAPMHGDARIIVSWAGARAGRLPGSCIAAAQQAYLVSYLNATVITLRRCSLGTLAP